MEETIAESQKPLNLGESNISDLRVARQFHFELRTRVVDRRLRAQVLLLMPITQIVSQSVS